MKKFISNYALPIFFVFFLSCFFYIIWYLQEQYFQTHDYYFDPAHYQYLNIKTYIYYKATSFIEAFIYIFSNASTNPLYHLGLLIVNPSLLGVPLGYLLVNYLSFITFLFFIYKSVRLYGFNHNVSIGFLILFIIIPGNFSHLYGLGSYYLDYPSGFIFASSLISAVIWGRMDKSIWLIVSITLVSFSVLMKYMNIIYFGIVYFPIVIYMIISKKRIPFRLIIYCLVIFMLLCGYTLIKHFQEFYVHYTDKAYAINNGLVDSASFFVKTIKEFFTARFLYLFIVLGIIYYFNLNKKELFTKKNIYNFFLILSYPLFFVLIVQTDKAKHSILFFIPLLFFSLVDFYLKNYSRRNSFKIIYFLSLVICLFLGNQTVKYIKLIHSKTLEIDEKHLITESISKEIISLKSKNITWDAFFDEYSKIPSIYTFYSHNILPHSFSAKIFTVHEAYWKTHFPNKTPQAISSEIYNTIDKNHNLVVVFSEPKNAYKYFNNRFSKEVAYNISNYVRNSDMWIQTKELDTKIYGKLAFYVNSCLTGKDKTSAYHH